MIQKIKGLHIYSDQFLLWANVTVGAIFLCELLIILTNIGGISDEIALRFNPLSGIEMFGGKGAIIGIWVAHICIVGLNMMIAETVFLKERIITYFLMGCNIFLALISLGVISAILSIN